MTEEIKLCRACGKEKPLKQFYKNKNIKDGYEARCKICKQSNKKVYKCEPKPIKKRSNSQIFLSAPTNEDWIATFTFLKNIGYSLSGDKSIHEQFCEKHGLKPKKRTYEKSIQFSPEDFDLI